MWGSMFVPCSLHCVWGLYLVLVAPIVCGFVFCYCSFQCAWGLCLLLVALIVSGVCV